MVKVKLARNVNAHWVRQHADAYRACKQHVLYQAVDDCKEKNRDCRRDIHWPKRKSFLVIRHEICIILQHIANLLAIFRCNSIDLAVVTVSLPAQSAHQSMYCSKISQILSLFPPAI